MAESTPPQPAVVATASTATAGQIVQVDNHGGGGHGGGDHGGGGHGGGDHGGYGGDYRGGYGGYDRGWGWPWGR
jgi:hypothetical protein